MPIRRSQAIAARFLATRAFVFASVNPITLVRGTSQLDQVTFQQGVPEVGSFGVGSIALQYYASLVDAQNNNNPLTSSSLLHGIASLEAFTQASDGSGNFNLSIDTGSITEQQFGVADRTVYIVLSVNQPNPGGGNTAIYTIPILITVTATSAFAFSGEMDFANLIRGSAIQRSTITWTQGDPEIANFALTDIVKRYFSNQGLTTEIISTNTLYNIGNQTLDDIFELDNFTGSGTSSGTVRLSSDPTGITETELPNNRTVYVALEVNQPNP
jgi:hypothetical protein